MSNTLFQAVFVFEGNNYVQWTDGMSSWLEANGLAYVMDEECPSPVTGDNGVVTNQEAIDSWKRDDTKAKGSIKLRLAPYVKSSIPSSDLATAKSLQSYLHKQYGSIQCADLFGYLQTALNAKFNGGEHPDPQINVVTNAFARLAAEDVEIPGFLQAMILLHVAKVKSVTESILQRYTQDELTVAVVREALLTHYSHNQSMSGANVQKFSNVKRKRDDPKYSNQQQSGSSAPNGGDKADKKKKDKRGQRGGKNKKDKGKGKEHAHAHATISEIVGSASISALTPSVEAVKTSHVALITPAGTQVRQVVEKPAVSADKAIADTPIAEGAKNVFATAKELDIRVTPEVYRELDSVVNVGGFPVNMDCTDDFPTPRASSSKMQIDDEPPVKRARVDDQALNSFLFDGTIDEQISWDLSPLEEYLREENMFGDVEINVDDAIAEAAGLTDADRQVPSHEDLLRNTDCGTQRLILSRDSVLYCMLTGSHLFCTNIFCACNDFAACPKCKGKAPLHGDDLGFPPSWLVDSGASLHVTSEESDLAGYEKLSEPIVAQTASKDTTLALVGRGTAFVDHCVTRRGRKVIMTSQIYPVYHVPGLHGRLLSLGSLLQGGLSVRGNSTMISLHRKNSPLSVLEFYKLNEVHTLYFLWSTPSTAKTVQSVSTVYKVDYDIMHRRFAHPSKDVLRQAKKHTKGFPQDLVFPEETRPCKGCAQGKMHQRAFPPSEHRAKNPFDVIHSDLKEFPTISYHKYRYFIGFFDEALSFGWTVCISQKSDAKQATRNFIAMVKNQFGATIKKWHIDNGGEFKGMGMEEFLAENGILVEKGAPYAHQQNGRAERFNRTIMDKAEAMRFTACLPNSFWEFAIALATRIYNWTPIRRLKWKTPYEALHKEKPDISHLRVFGCAAYVFIPEEKRQNKLSPKSELMTYLGIPDGVKGYLFMRSNTSLFVATQAMFDEEVFPRCPDSDSNRRQHVPVGDEPQRDDDPADPQDLQGPGDMPGDDDDAPPPPAPPAPPHPRKDDDGDDDDRPPSDQPRSHRDVTPSRIPRPRRDITPQQRRQEPAPVPDAPRRSTREHKIPYRPHNIYGPRRHPTDIIRDIQNSRGWKRMLGQDPGSSRSNPAPSNEQRVPDSSSQPASGADVQDDLDEQARMEKLCREGGVGLITELLSKAVPDEDVPDVSNIRNWTLRDIYKLPKALQKEWFDACREELEALRQRKVYSLVDRPKGRKVIKCRWVFDQKSDGRKRARLVAKGFSQVEGIDYDEIFSPVVRYETFRLVIALAALEGWHMSGLDVRKAFLYGDLDEEIYMEQPEGFSAKGKQGKVMLLHKAIYGLKQAALSWWKALTKSTKAMGWVRLTSDAGVFFYEDSNGRFCVIIVYVDDALFFSKDKKLIAFLKAEFNKRWECRNQEITEEFLRMRITRDGSKIKLDQIPYLDKVLQRFGMQNCKFASTPLPAGYVPMPNKDEVDPELRQKIQSVIGSLLFIMLGTRSDIAFAVTKLSQFAANPSQDHLHKALYICRYLAGTRDYALVFDGKSNGGLIAYTDSDWASDPIKRRSTTGFFMKLADGNICWQSRLQRTVASSSTEAEYMALSDCSRQVMWLKSVLMELKRTVTVPVPICGDNQGSIFTGSNAYRDRRMKHIDIRYHYIRELVEEKEVELFFIDGSDNPADLFTKNLGRTLFLKFRSQLGLEFYSS